MAQSGLQEPRPPPARWLPGGADALRIATWYLGLGALWIFGSGWLLHHFVHDARLAGWLEMLKGWAFVVVTAVLLGLALNRYFRQIRRMASRLQEEENRLRLIGDNLPDSYVYQYAPGPDGKHHFTYISAGVERIHGLKPEAVLRDGSCLFAQMDPAQLAANAAAEAESAAKLTVFEMDLRMRRTDGVERIVHVQSRPSATAAGRVVWNGLTVDVTAQREAETALTKREQHLEAILRTALDGIWLVDTEGRLLEVNDSACTMLGYSRTELLKRRIWEIDPAITEAAVAERMREIMQKGSAIFEAQNRCKNGRILDVEVSVNFLNQEGGRVVVFHRDITERKRVENALREQERLLRTVINLVPHPIFAKDRQSRHLIVNEACAAMNGLTPEQMMGRNDLGFVTDRTQAEAFMKDDREVIDSGRRKLIAEERFTNAAGQTKILQTVKIPFELPGIGPALLGVAVDITQRKAYETEIERLTRLYATLSQVNQAIVRCPARAELFTEICRVMIEFGKFQAVWIGEKTGADGALTTAAHASGGEDTARLMPAWQSGGCGVASEAFRTASPVICNHVQTNPLAQCCREASACLGVQSCAALPLRLQGRVCGAISICSGEVDFFQAEEVRLLEEVAMDISYALDRIQDATEHKRSQMRLERLNECLVSFGSHPAENITRLVALLGEQLEATCTLYNRLEGQQLRTSGHWNAPPDLCLLDRADGHICYDVIRSGDAGARVMRDLLNSSYAQTDPNVVRYGLKTYVGNAVFVEGQPVGSLCAVFKDDRLPSPDDLNLLGIVASAVGVEEKRQRLEAQFQHSQKLEAIGQLAGGVAHDFNNILTSMVMQVELCSQETELSRSLSEGLQQIRKDAERAASLTRQLLLFSRRQVMQSRDLDLNEIVTNLTKMLQRIIGEDVRLQLDLHPTPLMLHADTGMLDQVVMNLAVNARDAMPEGGRLAIETSEITMDEATARRQPDAAPGRHVCLSVTDTGCGIPPNVLPRIFEPFFTTKEAGKGSGLGLATVFGIVKQHRGWITVDSEPGRGTTFRVYLPAAVETKVAAAVESRRPAPGGTETILLAEDDAPLRRVTVRLLKHRGYRVLEAATGLEALEVWRENREDIALLFTDLVMPGGMSGRQLANELQAEKPGLKVILASGYSAEIAGQELQLRPGEYFMQKPFRPDDLLVMVRACLDG